MLLLQLQQPYLLIESFVPVEGGAVQYGPDVLQGELQLPKEQDALQARQGPLVVEPVPCLSHFSGLQQPQLVVVVQGPDADAGELAHLMDRHHLHRLPSCIV